MNFTYQILYWRDIPAQVKVRSGKERLARSLSPRFQEAIDEAAMRARTTGSDDYLEEWRSTEWQSEEGDPNLFAHTHPRDWSHLLKIRAMRSPSPDASLSGEGKG